MNLRLYVAHGVVARRLWAPGQRVAVAVSGGLDSVVLLDLLVRTAGVHGGVLSVVTVDHGTRPDSGDDAAFVVDLAGSLGLACVRVDAALGAEASEADARSARLAAFDGLDVDRVALAHHRDDQAETVLLGLLRGGGTRAVAGMAWQRGRLVRPLLDVSRDQLRAYATDRRLTWREDPTNASPRFLRNRIRHELLPWIEAARPGAGAALARGAGHAAEDDALLEALSVAEERHHDGGLSAAWVADGPAPLVRRALLRRLPTLTSALIDAIVEAARRGQGAVRVSEDVEVRVARGSVHSFDVSR